MRRAVILSLLLALAVPLTVSASSPSSSAIGHALINDDGITVAWIDFELQPPTAAEAVPGSYASEGVPGHFILSSRALIRSVDFYHDPTATELGPADVAHATAIECLYFDPAVNPVPLCEEVEFWFVDGGPGNDWFVAAAPGGEQNWFSVVAGDIHVRLGAG